MTTGSRTMNGRYSTTAANGSGGFTTIIVGRYSSRTWRGPNQSAVTFTRVYKLPSGIFTYKRTYLRSQRPPKGAKYEPHSYRVDWDSEQRALYRVKLENGYDQDRTGPGWTVALPTSVDQRFQYKLLATLRSKVYGNAWNPAVSIAEGKQTLTMIYNAAVRIGAALQYFRKGQYAKMRKVLPALQSRIAENNLGAVRKGTRAAAAAVLELQYGIRPLIGDVQDAAAWLAATLDPNRANPARYVARRSMEINGKVKPSDPYTVLYYLEQTVKIRMQVIALVTSVRSPYLPSLVTFAEAAWELIPYSFIGDWFIPVGAYLEAMKLRESISGKFITSIRVEQKGAILTVNKDNIRGVVNGRPWLGTDTAERGWFERTVSTELIVPRPFTVRSMKQALGMEHTVNAVALMRQLRWPDLAAIYEGHRYNRMRLSPF